MCGWPGNRSVDVPSLSFSFHAVSQVRELLAPPSDLIFDGFCWSQEHVCKFSPPKLEHAVAEYTGSHDRTRPTSQVPYLLKRVDVCISLRTTLFAE